MFGCISRFGEYECRCSKICALTLDDVNGSMITINKALVQDSDKSQGFKEGTKMEHQIIQALINRFNIEYRKRDCFGIYALTSREIAYNSNKIEGGMLTREQTASLFDTGMLPHSDDYYRAKDIEEMNGHFLMFNKMLTTITEPLTQDLIKAFHYELKSGVFEDRANGYAVGDYKKRPNMIGLHDTAAPAEVPTKMAELLDWYHAQKISLEVLAEFHARYEAIHPFQDGNGRTGRIILFRECLVHGIMPVIFGDDNRMEYIQSLSSFRSTGDIQALVQLFIREQNVYRIQVEKFLI